MEKIAYLIKQYIPALFPVIEAVARRVTVLRFGREIDRALRGGVIDGTVGSQPATIRPLFSEDIATLSPFLSDLPDDHLQYFKPHGFDAASLERVLSSKVFLNYGLFVNDALIGYALLKVAPTGTAFIGRLISPKYSGLGLGAFLSRFLYWQAGMAGLRPRSTISRHNAASLRSHESVSNYEIVSQLPNDYLLIEFPVKELEPPLLDA